MNLTAFIIDDDQICHFITRHLIKSENLAAEVLCFYEAAEALKQMLTELPESLPDMIFLDLNMPHMNGWQFLDALLPYASQVSAHTKIFILTSSVDAVDQEKAWDSPLVAGYFLKPLQARDLVVIREMLQAQSQ
jgi:CheY-like chemotaxis protein